MKNPLRIEADRAVKLSRFAAVAVAVVFGLAAAGFGGLALYANSNAAREEQRAKSLASEADDVRKVLAEARSKDAIRVRTESKAIADFQDSISKLAKDKGCVVAEFLASTDSQDFLTRFRKQGTTPGWRQIEVQLTLFGRGRNVVEAASALAELPIPIEFSTIQLLRERVDQEGAQIKAKIQLRVLVQSNGGTA